MTPFSLDWWGFVLILLLTLGLTFWAGIEWCRSTHRQRGIDTDDWSVVMPPDPFLEADVLEQMGVGRAYRSIRAGDGPSSAAPSP